MATRRDGGSSARHECPNCETVFIGSPSCPGCSWSPEQGELQAVVDAGRWTPHGERPCTAKQGHAASRICLDIALRKITREEGERRMRELFGGEQA